MEGPKYTRQTAGTYPDPSGTGGYGVQVTAWTDDAWNRAQEARRRYQADQEWQRAHPFLAGARRAIDGIGNFINNEILLNEGNIRVKNAQRHPEGLKWFREGGNEAVALLGLGTAPMWAPELAAALPTLSGAGESSLLSTIAPQVVSRTAPQTANLLNWGVGGLTAYTLGKALSENPPTFSTPSFSVPYSSGRVMATDATPTDSVGVTPANPSASTDSVGSTPAPTPEPERNDSTNQRRPSFRERLGDRIAGRNRGQASTGGNTPPNNNQERSFLQRMLWETKNNNFGQNWWQWRNVGRVGLGLSYPARETVWPAVGKGLKYMAVGPDSVPTPAAPQAAPAQPVTTPTDTVPGQAQPDSTSYNSFDAELEELRKAYGGN